MKGVRGQARFFLLPKLRFARHSHPPDADESTGGTFIGGVEFVAHLEWAVAQRILHPAKINFPRTRGISRRHDLIIGFDLLADLLADFFELGLSYRNLLAPFEQ